MNGIFDHISPETAIKWGVTILITGFIAQFGKRFATFLIEKAKSIKKPDEESNDTEKKSDAITAQSHPAPDHPSEYAKAEKKRVKALSKALKKTGKYE